MPEMIKTLAEVLKIEESRISIKAKTSEKWDLSEGKKGFQLMPSFYYRGPDRYFIAVFFFSVKKHMEKSSIINGFFPLFQT